MSSNPVTASEAIEGARRQSDVRPYGILVVDDEPAILELLELLPGGRIFLLLESGEQVLELAALELELALELAACHGGRLLGRRLLLGLLGLDLGEAGRRHEPREHQGSGWENASTRDRHGHGPCAG